MNSIEIKIGDLFVYKSKYGGVVKGEIGGFHVVHSLGEIGLILKYKIRSTNGVFYELNEIELCKKFYTEQERINLATNMATIAEKKRSFSKKPNQSK